MPTGEIKTEPVKCISSSHPLFQEARLWQWMKNLKIFYKESDEDVTKNFLTCDEDYVALFDWLDNRKEVDHKSLLSFLLKTLGLKSKQLTAEVAKYRWNYVYDALKDESKKYPCNETKAQMLTALEKVQDVPYEFLTKEREEALWHILYSVTDKIEIETALKTFARKNGLKDDFAEIFKKLKPYDNDYGSYSAKALKKLLPLMRKGNAWKDGNNQKVILDNNTTYRKNINAIIQKIKSRSDKTANTKLLIELEKLEDDVASYKGLPIHIACYAAYGYHSEEGEITKWKTVGELEAFVKGFKQHSLRNPIVEQVITETLRVVKDIWIKYGEGKENYFDEIHIELGREMKNPADKRKTITEQVTKNENTNLRIKALLVELQHDPNIENVITYSPYQQEILKIYEEGLLSADDDIPDDILKISQLPQPLPTDLKKYKLWLEQGYASPYTGATIPLSKLFTPAYEIEHIIPQSRFYDDSFTNKVICEAAVNKLKDNQTGMEFILNNYGRKIEGVLNPIFTKEQYESHVKRYFFKSPGKMKKLLMDDIPAKMVERQMNDTRYISKMVKNYLSNIVRKENNDEGTTSINVLSGNGQITSTLRNDWGFNNIWNELIAERFIRLNGMTNSNDFGDINPNTNKFLPTVPLGLSKGFSKKRIDHRHHALDALVIACATRSHINFLNNKNALEKDKKKGQKERQDLRYLLCDKKYNNGSDTNYKWIFKQPWSTIAKETKQQLENTVVSFKQNLRVINKTVNHFQRYVDGKKEMVKQDKGDSWAIRKSLHTPMPYGKKQYDFDMLKIAESVGKWQFIDDEFIKNEVCKILHQFDNKVTLAQNHLKKNPIKNNEGKDVLATAFKISTEKYRRRQPISKLSNRGQGGLKTFEDVTKFINKIADIKLQKDLLLHLKVNDNNIDKAFSAEGIEQFNSKRKIPIYKLPIAESGEKRFPLGTSLNTKHQYVEASEGTNLFFAIYQNKKERKYVSIAFNEVIQSQKLGAIDKIKPENCSVPQKYFDIKTKEEYPLLFHLSPNDLVYVPKPEEIENPQIVDFANLNKEQVKRVYKCVSFSGKDCFFSRHDIATVIMNKVEFSPLNKMERSIEGTTIKNVCWKLSVDRLGNVTDGIN